jgi:hypothetical protein
MVFSDALEVAIGLTFVFLLVSLVMTVVLEYVESLLKTRGANLLDGIEELLGDPQAAGSGRAAAAAVYTHPLIQGLYRGSFAGAAAEKRLPSYVPSRNFALALVDQVLAGQVNAAATNASLPAGAPLGDRLRLAAERLQNEHLRRAVMQAAARGGDDLERVREHFERWYDSAMDRVSGRYKRRAQHWLFWFGIAGALLLNVNTLTIAESLSKNATLRRAVVAQAERQTDVSPTAADAGRSLREIDRLGLPVGWSRGSIDALLIPMRDEAGAITPGRGTGGLVQIVFGYLLTALAVSLGAPFWFDVLNRLMVIRSTVKPHEKSPEEGSQDRHAESGAGLTVVTAAPRAAAAPPPVPLAERPVDRDVYAAPPLPGEKPFEEWD